MKCLPDPKSNFKIMNIEAFINLAVIRLCLTKIHKQMNKLDFRILKANISQENWVLCHFIRQCFALEHSAFKTKHLKMS